MKPAFSLLEALLAIILVSILAVLLFKPLENMYFSYQKFEANSKDFLALSTALILVEKLVRDCLQVQTSQKNLHCLLQDSENILQMRGNELFIGSSGVVLEKGGRFYAPKSHFSYEFVEDNKSYLGGVLINQQNLRPSKQESLFFYALSDKQIYEAMTSGEELFFTGASFTGFYKLILGEFELFEEQNSLYYHFTPFQSTDKFKALLLENLSEFEILSQNNALIIRLCKNKSCLQKELL